MLLVVELVIVCAVGGGGVCNFIHANGVGGLEN